MLKFQGNKWNCWSLPYNYGSRDLVEKMIVIIIIIIIIIIIMCENSNQLVGAAQSTPTFHLSLIRHLG